MGLEGAFVCSFERGKERERGRSGHGEERDPPLAWSRWPAAVADDEAAQWQRRAGGGEEGAVDGGGGRGAAAARPGARAPGVELHSIQRPPAAHWQVLPPPVGQQAPAGPQDVRTQCSCPAPSYALVHALS
jgi:hypothetical protein